MGSRGPGSWESGGPGVPELGTAFLSRRLLSAICDGKVSVRPKWTLGMVIQFLVTQKITLTHHLKQIVKQFELKVQLKIELKKHTILPTNFSYCLFYSIGDGIVEFTKTWSFKNKKKISKLRWRAPNQSNKQDRYS